MFVLKKKAEARIAALQDEAAYERQWAARQNARANRAEQEAQHWRDRAETAESSPEIKADTEASFSRGKAYKGNQVRSGISTRTRPQIVDAINELRNTVMTALGDLEHGCQESSTAGKVIIPAGSVVVGENVTEKIREEIERANKTNG